MTESASQYAPTAPYRTVGDLIDAYMSAYTGRDMVIGTRLSVWKRRLGDALLSEITDDDVFHGLEWIASQPAKTYGGRDAEGRAVFRAKGPRSPGTINRYHAALAAAFTWGIRRRRVPKGFENPCRRVPKQTERPGVVRFLSDDERVRLLEACRASKWPRMYALVLLALTTGARRGELEGLRWRDVNLDRAEALVPTTKNGAPKLLPLLPAVVEELRRFSAEDAAQFKIGVPSRRVFGSRLRPDLAFNFSEHWKAALRTARIRSFRFHDCRHTTASYLAQQGASLLEIADVLGHRQLEMVRRYSHFCSDSKKALVHRVLGDIR